jgi:hypothetical protein
MYPRIILRFDAFGDDQIDNALRKQAEGKG